MWRLLRSQPMEGETLVSERRDELMLGAWMLLSAELVGPKISGFRSSVDSCLCSKEEVH